MLFYAAKVMRDPRMGNPTLVFLTDRNDLDDQLFDEVFADAQVGDPCPRRRPGRDPRRAASAVAPGARRGGIIFSTLQKFGLPQAIRTGDRNPRADRPAQRRGHGRRGAPLTVRLRREARRPRQFMSGPPSTCATRCPTRPTSGSRARRSRRRTSRPAGLRRLHRRLRPDPVRVDDGATVKIYYESAAGEGRAAREPTKPSTTLRRRDHSSRSRNRSAGKLRPAGRGSRPSSGGEAARPDLAQDIVEHWEQRREVLVRQGHDRRDVAPDRRARSTRRSSGCARTGTPTIPAQGQIKVVITGSAADPACSSRTSMTQGRRKD